MSLGKLSKHECAPTPAAIEELENILGANPGEGTPKIFAYYDRAGKVRRMLADYPNGWTVRVNVNAKGFVTSTSFKICLKTKVGGDAQG